MAGLVMPSGTEESQKWVMQPLQLSQQVHVGMGGRPSMEPAEAA